MYVGGSRTLTLYATDPNGDPVKFSAQLVSSTVAGVTVSVTGNKLTIKAPYATGTAQILVTASDGSLTDSQVFTVTISGFRRR
jgi:hypothetical protein